MSADKKNLFEQFMQIQWLLTRHHVGHHIHQALGLMGNPYSGQGRVLKLLKMQPEITQKELSDLLAIRPQSLGDLVKKLEQNGYVTRTPVENDKRAMIIRLTAEGEKAEIQNDKQLGLDELFNCLNEEEQTQLSEYLSRLIDKWSAGRRPECGLEYLESMVGHHGIDKFFHHRP